MRRFTCSYLTESGDSLEGTQQNIVAPNPETAAALYSKRYPEEFSRILLEWGSGESEVVFNTLGKERAIAKRTSLEKKAAEAEAEKRQRLKPLQDFLSVVKNASGNLRDLPYHYLSALIENMRAFPGIRDGLSPEECAIREELYKVAFFDRDLQAGLQTEQAELQTKILNQIASGKSTTGTLPPGFAGGLAGSAAIALHRLNKIEENTGDVSEGLGFD